MAVQRTPNVLRELSARPASGRRGVARPGERHHGVRDVAAVELGIRLAERGEPFRVPRLFKQERQPRVHRLPLVGEHAVRGVSGVEAPLPDAGRDAPPAIHHQRVVAAAVRRRSEVAEDVVAVARRLEPEGRSRLHVLADDPKRLLANGFLLEEQFTGVEVAHVALEARKAAEAQGHVHGGYARRVVAVRRRDAVQLVEHQLRAPAPAARQVEEVREAQAVGVRTGGDSRPVPRLAFPFRRGRVFELDEPRRGRGDVGTQHERLAQMDLGVPYRLFVTLPSVLRHGSGIAGAARVPRLAVESPAAQVLDEPRIHLGGADFHLLQEKLVLGCAPLLDEVRDEIDVV